MADLATTRLSSKGQVVIPEEIRRALGLEPGARFVVLSDGEVVILKRIDAPARSEVRALAAKVRRQARGAGVKPEIDEDISVEGMLDGVPARRPKSRAGATRTRTVRSGAPLPKRMPPMRKRVARG
jgi:AbrB family looped-hinge helix DNA binding protein